MTGHRDRRHVRPMNAIRTSRGNRSARLLATAMALALHAMAAPPGFHEHLGMANASAVAILQGPWFAVASDESNTLRVFQSDKDGEPSSLVDLGPHAGLLGRSDELDIEGAARVGNLVFWMGSHGRSKEGKARPNRQRILATRVVGDGANARLQPSGVPYTRFLQDILADTRYAALGLAAASRRAPEQGGINVEGMAATPGGGLVVGFRSPLVHGKALAAPILNPAEIMEDKQAMLGDPLLLDLDGRGIRDMTWTGKEWFVIGGGAKGAGKPRLYRWAGGASSPEPVKDTGFKHFHPEALAARASGTGDGIELLVLSDDGGGKSPNRGSPAKFRSFLVKP